MNTIIQQIEEAHDDDEIDFYDWFTNHKAELIERETLLEAKVKTLRDAMTQIFNISDGVHVPHNTDYDKIWAISNNILEITK